MTSKAIDPTTLAFQFNNDPIRTPLPLRAMPPGVPIPDHLRLQILSSRTLHSKTWVEISSLMSLPPSTCAAFHKKTVQKCEEAGIPKPTHQDLMRFWKARKRGGTRSVIRQDNFEEGGKGVEREREERKMRRRQEERGRREREERRLARVEEERTRAEVWKRVSREREIRDREREREKERIRAMNSHVRGVPMQFQLMREVRFGERVVLEPLYQPQPQAQRLVAGPNPSQYRREVLGDGMQPVQCRMVAVPIYRGPFIYYTLPSLPARPPPPRIYNIVDNDTRVNIKIEDEDDEEEVSVVRSTRVDNVRPERVPGVKLEIEDDYGTRFVEELRRVVDVGSPDETVSG